MLDVKSYVRDFYAYKRSSCPELILTKMDETKGLEQLQRQVGAKVVIGPYSRKWTNFSPGLNVD